MSRRILLTLGEATTATHCGDCPCVRRYHPYRVCEVARSLRAKTETLSWSVGNPEKVDRSSECLAAERTAKDAETRAVIAHLRNVHAAGLRRGSTLEVVEDEIARLESEVADGDV